MPTSDSEDFESADEGHGSPDKKERKKRLSSSNYSDGALEAEQKLTNTQTTSSNVQKVVEDVKDTDGWDDFDIEDNEPIVPQITKSIPAKNKTKLEEQLGKTIEDVKSQDTGWDDFDDWGQDDAAADTQKVAPPKPQRQPSQPPQPEPNIQEVTDRLAATSTGGSGWGWGWSVDSLLSTATAGITNITSQVSQGISTVLETGIGAPDPEELARINRTSKDNDSKVSKSDHEPATPSERRPEVGSEEATANTGDAFQFGSLFSGVTKFVETTGTKVIHGGLDTLETIGKKTMEVLQDGDPGLAKKRALLGLGANDKPVLSQVLREAKAKAEEDDRVREEKREAKEVHYENLFDDFEGLVHLEALEMLSKQVSMRIEERIRSVDADKRQDIKETLQQVAELCEMPEEDEEEEESPSAGLSKPDAFHERLQTATQDLGLKLQFQPLVKQYTEILAYITSLEADVQIKSVYKRGVSCLAQSTALSVEQYHKAAEMLLVKPRRSTADEADALTQMTVVLTKHISELATLFTEKLNALPSDNKEQVNTYITNIFLEAGNSSTYIQNAFQLALPILQIGAV
ncbi:protein FAM114A2 [Helicoverpa zea]|uniref:protein FAM114A2 n=1 Tax=Helicoverpa zea TaxID=7113 RepID=UPI001F5825AB|nr:protein FAM114A2 [Helicoverpa zea]